MINKINVFVLLLVLSCISAYGQTKETVLAKLNLANRYWQSNNKPQVRAFWDHAAYQTGNMELFGLTKEESYKKYAEDWAIHNEWKGAKSNNRSEWKYKYGESDQFVLFGDWQICFQTYIDLYNISPDPIRIERAKEVMEYQMSTPNIDYWWWADGLYMVMPVMSKLYKLSGNKLYSEKLFEYFNYANSIMYDRSEKLYYRDANFVFPKHKTINGRKDFWARGDGWVFAALAKVLKDLPENDPHRKAYLSRFKSMAKALVKCQNVQGYWSRSLLDQEFAPGPETSGTAFFTYGMLWGINSGILKGDVYESSANSGWDYLSKTAFQPDGRIGFVQPIGARAIPGQILDSNSTANFGVGAFLLAGCEKYRYELKKEILKK
ncbi:glycosyl hydrolase family 88 [Pedobacter ginsenosidimutans]|uniref:Glycosyl hydrolase family 88 n=1 Tax=Pedobacter ginsenosidimutans TaxID=687842 RepID=A0A0T5VXC4_9SPHI|nr:glycoside hydrolase family 88 protein [Pedobacter ginsenosidimutans]KRT17845.1 glycosyl hydrolase family 88 [Pedobacter ginsenosidimutans]